jgi:HK97 family phage portal protein
LSHSTSRRLGIEEIARLFLVPVQLIGDMSQGNYNTSEAVMRWFGMFCVAGWAAKIAAEFNRSILSSPYSFTIDVSALVRGDPATVYRNYQSARAAGWMTANEIRQRENLPAHPDGNELTPPSVISADAQADDAKEGSATPPPKSTLNGHAGHS